MRSYKLTSAILAAAALLALASAGTASARSPHLKHRNGILGANCRISLNVAPRLVTSGETVLAYGQATCPPNEAGQTVTLFQRVAGSSGFAVAGTTTTDSRGAYQMTTAPETTNSQFYAAIGANLSRHRSLKVAAQVTLTGPPESKQLLEGLKTGRRNAVSFTGTVSPDDVGALVILQRQNAIRGNEWHRIGHTLVTSAVTSTGAPTGTYTLAHAFVSPGASDIRVLVKSNKRNIASPSNVLSYQISQAQNPSLTILSSTDPIPYGGSTVISGTVAGAPNTTVTLAGHAAHNPFVTITTAKTDAEGNYTFPAQSPLVSTFYKVTGAGRSSAVLYEGVKYLLTAAVSATTVTSGQPLTFTGTVTPARAGHAIYLERQNVAGTGFHVISIGTLAADGSYSITRNLYAPGSDVLRVKVPGDPENGGTASDPFTITVAPLPSTAKLAPEPPGNSTLPPEGQV
jgi:hypothetical protein